MDVPDLVLLLLTVTSFCLLRKIVQIRDNTSPVYIADIIIENTAKNSILAKPVQNPDPYSIINDGRPFTDYYRHYSNFEETILCTNGTFDCQEQQQISKIFAKNYKMPFFEYREIIKDYKLASNGSQMIFEKLSDREIRIQSVDSYGRLRTNGGDYFIARLASTDLNEKERIFIRGSVTDFKNGSYLVEFPNTDMATRLNKKNEQNGIQNSIVDLFLNVEIFLVRNNFLMEFNRRAMTAYQTLTMDMQIPFNPDPNEFCQNAKGDCSKSFCGFYPFEKACNYSETSARSYYCYHPVLPCPVSKHEFVVTVDLSGWSLGDVLNQIVPESVHNKHERNFQQLVYADEYKFDETVAENLDFDFWAKSKYQNFNGDKNAIPTGYSGESAIINVVGNNHLIHESQIEDIYSKIVGKTLVIIGDSLGRQLYEFYRVFFLKCRILG